MLYNARKIWAFCILWMLFLCSLGTAQAQPATAKAIVLDHAPFFELAQGTVAFEFTANDVSGTQGLLSKDASGPGNGGHITASLNGNTLEVRFQNTTDGETVTIGGITQGATYHVTATFDGITIAVYLNGTLVDARSFIYNMIPNQELLVIGALGWASTPSTPDLISNFFEGTIANLHIWDVPFLPSQVNDIALGIDSSILPVFSLGDPVVFDESAEVVQYAPTQPEPADPVFITHAMSPGDFMGNVGDTVTLTCEHPGLTPDVRGSAPDTYLYEWKLSSAIVAEGNSNTYTTLPLLASDDDSKYYCVIYVDGVRYKSPMAKIRVAAAPVGVFISELSTPGVYPEELTVTEGESLTLTCEHPGNVPDDDYYRWKLSSTFIDGEHTELYTPPAFTLADDDSKFYCVIYVNGAYSPSEMLRVRVVPQSLGQVYVDPPRTDFQSGYIKTLTCEHPDNPVVDSYRWKISGVYIEGATSKTYTTPPLTPDDDFKNYYCEVTRAGLSKVSVKSWFRMYETQSRTLAWDASDGEAQGIVDFYILYYRYPNSGQVGYTLSQAFMTVGLEGMLSVNNLPLDTLQCFAATAATTEGDESEYYSNEVCLTTGPTNIAAP